METASSISEGGCWRPGSREQGAYACERHSRMVAESSGGYGPEVLQGDQPEPPDGSAGGEGEDSAFTFYCTAAYEELDEYGDQGRLCYSSGTWYILIFQHGKYWVRVFIYEDSYSLPEDARRVAGLLAAHVDQEIDG